MTQKTDKPQPSPDEHARAVSGMFGRIAGWYDFLNHSLSLGQDIIWRKRLVRLVRTGPTSRFLDLAAGTLDVSIALAKKHPGSLVLGMDFSLPMLAKGRKKLAKLKKGRVLTVPADGRFLPLPDTSVDSVTIAFGIRNIVPREAAFREIFRVLAPGGRLCVLEFGSGKSRIMGGLYNFYLTKVLPGIGRIISRDKGAYRYLSDTILAFPNAEDLAEEMRQSGFDEVFYRRMSLGVVYLHCAEKPASG